MVSLNIELISDYICPWCYLGKARLERVRSKIENKILLEIDILPYVLYPDIPKGGISKSYFANKTNPNMGKALRLEAANENIQLNYKNIHRIPNSLEAHRLVWLVKNKKIKYGLAKKIFDGYFKEGYDIEDESYLIHLAKSIQVDGNVLDDFVSSDKGFAQVQSSILNSKREFITAVPSLRLDSKFIISGLQPDDVWEKYIYRAAAKKSQD